MRLLRRIDMGIAATMALILPALSALAQPALPRGGDLLLHFYRLVALDSCIRRGLLYPRWMPDLVFGYGYPLFHFYAPLSAYLGEALHLAGFSFALSVRLVSALALVGVAVGTYLWARDALGSPRAGLAAAVAAAYAPFVLSTPLSRGSISDGVALAILPFAFWTLDRLRRQPAAPRLAAAALALAALFLSHNVTAMVACPILALYALAGALEARPGPSRFSPLLALALGLGLSAFFWYPALADKGWTRLDLFTADLQYDYRANFVSLDYLLRFPAPTDTGLMNPAGPYHINPLVPLAGLVGLAWAWRSRRTARLRLASLWLAGIFLLYLCLAPSAWLWARIPFLPVIQFPFRLLGPAGVVLALPAAALLAGEAPIGRPWVRRLATAAFLLALAVPSTPLLYPLRESELPAGATLEDVSRFQSDGAYGTTSSGEYLPKTIEQLPAGPAFAGMDLAANLADKLDRAGLPASAQVEPLRSGPLQAEWQVRAPAALDITVNTFYFPGWQARLDGRPLEASPAPGSGLIRFTVPAGEHHLALRFGPTAVTQRAAAISALAAALLLALLIAHGLRRRRQAPVPAGQPARARRADAALFAALGLALLMAKVAVVDQVDNPWRRSYEGQEVPPGAQALNVDLGGAIRLLGIEPLPVRIEAGEGGSLVLYWSALMPLDRQYSVSIQIVDEHANKVGQHERVWPGGYPTVWWRVGEYNCDSYELEIGSDVPTGRYRVLVVLYDESGQRLLPPPGTPGAQLGALEVQQIQVVAAG